MKKLLLFLNIVSVSYVAYSQCTPVNCLSSLPPYGGVCDTVLMDGVVNTPYSDFESFHITTACFDAGLVDPNNAGIGIKITSIHTFSFTNLPAGITGAPNQTSYTSPANGCVSFSGIPTQIGYFLLSVNFKANVTAYPFGGGSCTGFSVNQNNNDASYEIYLKIKPNPSFNLPSNTYCLNDPPVAINLTGTSGGTFSGPGVSGTTFDPSIAGVGTHIIKYVVSAQQGAAIAPASDSAFFTVQVVSPAYNYYVDADADGYGDANASPLQSCNATPPSGYVANNTDCDDTNPGINPGALEVPLNGIDENCDGIDNIIDNDNDGYDSSVDCNDNDPSINPGATEICDGIDNNCNSNIDEGFTFYTYYLDTDGDGYGVSSSTISSCLSSAPTGYASQSGDCNDLNPLINPGMTELCDNLDNNCNGQVDEGLPIITFYLDADLDGYGVSTNTVDSCAPPLGYSPLAGDCDDSNPNINPGISEACDGIDNNCNGNIDEGLPLFIYYADADGDGYGSPNDSIQNCGPISGYVSNNDDCDDNNILINPSIANDPYGNAIDENCDGVDGHVNVENILQALGIRIFPNPANDKVYLSGNANGECRIRIFNMQGRMMNEKIITFHEIMELPVDKLPSGTYMIEFDHFETGISGYSKLLIVR
jgi:hypothetical protein